MGVTARWAHIVVAFLLSWMVATAAAAQEPDGSRVALVIGNSDYVTVGILPNPIGDAHAIGEAFRRMNFDVTEVDDADYLGMRRAVQDFETKVAGAEIAVVYYAGHGIEIGGENYLIPTDAVLARDTHVLDEAIPLSRVITAVNHASRLGLVILDACRDNPFTSTMVVTDASRAIGRGLARVEPTGSIMIAYAAKEGTTADDGDGEHSPFTTALLGRLETPGLEVSFLFRQVRDDVLTATGGLQEPFVYGTLGGAPIYFKELQAPPQQQVPDTPPVNAGQDQAANELAAYQAAVAINTIEAWDVFLRYFSTGYYAELAIAARNKLAGPEAVAQGPDGPGPAEDLPVFIDVPPEPVETPIADDDDALIAACDAAASYRFDPDVPEGILTAGYFDVRNNIDAAEDACRAAVDAAPDNRRVLYELGRVYAVAEDMTHALEFYRQAAELGSAAAMNEIGLAYKLGQGVEQDYVQAADWFRRGAEAGGTDAMINLGHLYDNAQGVPEDLDESGRWFQLAADLGNPEAMAAIGYRYDYGRGVDVDFTEALRWYRLAADGGSSSGMLNVGYFFDWGQGVQVDYDQALNWYEQARALGNSLATSNLGYMYENGRGVAVDYDQARSLYEEAAAGGNEYGMYNLGRLYEGGIGVPRDYAAAMSWYQRAAENGHTWAMNRLGVMYDNGWGVDPDPAAARGWWEQAAAAGVGDALHNLGYLYEIGRGVAKDLARAADYYVQALAMRNPATIDEFLNYGSAYNPEVRRAVQQFLIDQGLLTGSPSGNIDDRTKTALISWRDG